MVYTGALTIAAAALLAALPASASLYTKNSPVIQIDGRNYDRLIAQSNYTSVGGPPLNLPAHALAKYPSRSSNSTLRGADTARTSNPHTRRLPRTLSVLLKSQQSTATKNRTSRSVDNSVCKVSRP